MTKARVNEYMPGYDAGAGGGRSGRCHQGYWGISDDDRVRLLDLA